MNLKRFAIVTVLSAVAVAGLAWSGLAHDLIARLSYSVEYGRAEAARSHLSAGADLEHAFELVAEALQPSVVSIASTRVLRTPTAHYPIPQNPFGDSDPFFGTPFRRFFEDQMPREGLKQRGLGSGVIVSKDGYILTNNHVVASSDDLQVHLVDKRTFKAKVVGTDQRTDLAVIKIDATDLLAANLGDSDAVKVGQWVAAFGSPFGLEQTVTSGIISAKGRANLGVTDFEDFLQTDAAINQGNSGGPLVNLKGEVIGINTAIFSRSGGSAGIGFAIPSSLARSIMERLISGGKVVRGWLGVYIQDLNADLSASFGLGDRKGVLVADVTPGSPAETGGLKAGDVILRLDGSEVTAVTSFRNRVAELTPGTAVKFLLWRDRQEQELSLAIGEAPSTEDAAPPAAADSGLGLELHDLTAEMRQNFALDARIKGAVVTRVEPGSPADDAGIRPGDVVVGVANKPVTTAAAVSEALAAHDLKRGVVLRLRSGDTTRFIVLRVAH